MTNIPTNALNVYTRKFKKAFDPLCKARDSALAFSAFIEIAALTIHQAPYHGYALLKDETFDRIERQYLEAIKGLSREELDRISELMGICRVAIRFLQMDFLGHVYMTLGIGGNQRGQFFTPAGVQKLLARLTLRPLGAVLAAKGRVTLHEPAIGSGGMMIEAANEFEWQGFDPRKAMWFLGIDADRRCFNMAYFQLATLDLCGEVIHGNTLSMEIWESRATPADRVAEAYRSHRAALEFQETAETCQASCETRKQFVFDFTMPSGSRAG